MQGGGAAQRGVDGRGGGEGEGGEGGAVGGSTAHGRGGGGEEGVGVGEGGASEGGGGDERPRNNREEHRDKFISLGMIPQHFGTHSIRKGAVTHISTGSTLSPPIASICIRGKWNMPEVMNEYINFENAGDQFVVGKYSRQRRMMTMTMMTSVDDKE